MLSAIREDNEKLRQKLKQLREDKIKFTNIAFDTTENFVPKAQSNISHLGMLSDRAKIVRGEASKRIENLLQDWREYKDRTDEEIRRRTRSEQHLKELLARKDRELDELGYELASFRNLALDQKKTVEQLLEEKDADAKYRQKSAEVELKYSKLTRRYNEVIADLQAREEVLETSSSERDALLSVNAELRKQNHDQRRKLEICEKDVSETRLELEMLEEMVKQLNDKKSFFSATFEDLTDIAAPSSNRLEIGRNTPRSRHNSGPFYPQHESTKNHSTLRYHDSTKSGLSISSISSDNESQNQPNSSDSHERSMESKKSALTALRSLQKEHDKQCSDLASRIEKLKKENKLKDLKLEKLSK